MVGRFQHADADERDQLLRPTRRRRSGAARAAVDASAKDERTRPSPTPRPSAKKAPRRPCAIASHGGSLAYVGTRQQPRPSAAPARARGRRARAPAAVAACRAVRPTTSRPLGCDARPQPDYVNAVAALRDALAPKALLRTCTRSSAGMAGSAARTPAQRARARSTSTCWRSAAAVCAQRRLTFPHPRMHQRAFVLRPLLDVAPAAISRAAARRAAGCARARGQRIARTRRRAWR